MEELLQDRDYQYIYERTQLISRRSTDTLTFYRKNLQIQEQDDDDLVFLGKFKNLRAFKPISRMKSLKYLFQTIWIYPNQLKPSEVTLNYQDVLKNYQAHLMVSICKVMDSNKKTKQYLQRNPQIAFEIWFKEESVLQDKQFKEFKKETKQNKIKVEYIYCNQTDVLAKKKFKQNKNNRIWSFVTYGTNDINQLKLQIYQRNALANFVYLATQKKLANILKMGLSLIIRQQPIELNFAMENFYELVIAKWDERQRENVLKFVQNFKKNKIQSILTRYTEQDFFYKFINNALRVWKYPTEIFYLQPIIKRFFDEIKQQYRKQKKYKRFYKDGVAIFYRGALIREDELDNFKNHKGKYICSLGFTSTSRNPDKAKNFVKNALITIISYECERDDETDHGFAEPKSKNQQEQEVIFNTLNIFRVKEVKFNDKQKYWDIQLIYGQFAQYLYLYDRKIKKMPPNLSENAVLIKNLSLFQRQTTKVKDQLDILVKCGERDLAIKYCNDKIKYISDQLHQQSRQVIECKKELIQVYLQFQNFHEAKQQLLKINGNLDQLQQFEKIKDVVLCKLYGQTMEGLGKIAKSEYNKIRYYEQAYNALKHCLDLLEYSQKDNKFNIQESLMTALDRKQLKYALSEQKNKKQISQILNSLSNVTFQLGSIKESQQFSYTSILLAGEITDHHTPTMITRQFVHTLKYKNMKYPYLKVAIENYLSSIEAQDGQNVAKYINSKLLFTLYQISEENEEQPHNKQKIWNILSEMAYFYKQACLAYTPAENSQYFFIRALILSIFQEEHSSLILEACKSVLFFREETKQNSFKYAWVNLQIGNIQNTQENLKVGIEILQQLQEKYSVNYNKLKIKALNKLLNIYNNDDHNEEQVQKLYGHLILINLDQDIQMKNKYYLLYQMLANLYKKQGNYKMAQTIIKDFYHDNKDSLKLIPFQVLLLDQMKRFKQAYRKISRFETRQNSQDQLNYQQQLRVDDLFAMVKKDYIVSIAKQIQGYYRQKSVQKIVKLLKEQTLSPDKFQYYLQVDDYARCMIIIGKAYQSIHNYEEAIPYYKKAIGTETLTDGKCLELQKDIDEMKNYLEFGNHYINRQMNMMEVANTRFNRN